MQEINHSRRAFFKGRIRQVSHAKLPPWAREDFTDLCTRCDACITACEANLLMKGDGGFPEVNFSYGGCNWCEACVTVCEADALDIRQSRPWNLKASVNQNCLSVNGVICRACGDICETRAIRFQIQIGGKARPVIDVDSCDGCGFCYFICPELAIELKEAS